MENRKTEEITFGDILGNMGVVGYVILLLSLAAALIVGVSVASCSLRRNDPRRLFFRSRWSHCRFLDMDFSLSSKTLVGSLIEKKRRRAI